MRQEAKRLTKKETIELIKKAFLAGEEVGRENAKNIYWTTYPKVAPMEALQNWKEQVAKECLFLK